MPYLNDDELTSLHKKIDTAEENLSSVKKEFKEVSEELNEAKLHLENHEGSLKSVQKNKTLQNVILSILFGIALALAYYFYSNNNVNNSQIDINQIKQLEATRILDSIKAINIDTTYSEDNLNTIDSEMTTVDDAVQTIKNNVNNEKIYSVQVGAFSESNYTLLSETLAGISSKGDLFKYSIGLFKTLREAQDFRRELVRIGFNDAFVASYINGVRQEIENPN